MKLLPFYFTLALVGGLNFALGQSSMNFKHPREQIALQLGAIQMGYEVPFSLDVEDPENLQQAVNAYAMGLNSLMATVARPAELVQGVVSSPSVDSVEYRDQLYQAVEAVVTSPVAGTIKGKVVFQNGTKRDVFAKIEAPHPSHTIPVPFALEARSCADIVNVYDELVAVGILAPLQPEMIAVPQGALPETSAFAGTVVRDFEIGKYEVTWVEWQAVRDWALPKGYGFLSSSGFGRGGKYPVSNVGWHEALAWCNALSEREGLQPVYKVNGEILRQWRAGSNAVVVADQTATGYRLPTEAEWEWAARGGTASKNSTYSGGSQVGEVAWIGSEPIPVGSLGANEVGIHDMSGNVAEWCWDAFDPETRVVKGGACNRDLAESAIGFRRGVNPGFFLQGDEARLNPTGFRILRYK